MRLEPANVVRRSSDPISLGHFRGLTSLVTSVTASMGLATRDYANDGSQCFSCRSPETLSSALTRVSLTTAVRSLWNPKRGSECSSRIGNFVDMIVLVTSLSSQVYKYYVHVYTCLFHIRAHTHARTHTHTHARTHTHTHTHTHSHTHRERESNLPTLCILYFIYTINTFSIVVHTIQYHLFNNIIFIVL